MTKSTYKRNIYVIDGRRTPFLKAKGIRNAFTASDLAVYAARSLFDHPALQPTLIDEVITGCVMPSAREANIARVIALRLGCGHAVPAFTVQRNCASGLQAIDSAALNIHQGLSHLVLAGGTEAMSHAPLLYNGQYNDWLAQWWRAKTIPEKLQALTRFKLSYLHPEIGILLGLTDHIVNLSMGQTAEILAKRFAITRSQADAFALESHQRLANAIDSGYMHESISLYDGAGQTHGVDDGMRRDTSMEKLASLKPQFDKRYGQVTAGNSSQVTDGAAFVLLADEDYVRKHKLPVLGRIIDIVWTGVDPAQMGLGPAHAIFSLLQRHHLKLNDIDYIEINEAFAAQVLAVVQALASNAYCEANFNAPAVGEIDLARLNIDGGAIALGHPVGASGARLVLHLLHVLRRKRARYGIASLCIGGGQGGAALIEHITEVK